ncbi:MAG TPA: hypothetical protein VK688_02405, partial [Gemmatimonadales bacterium]|nr:hypothetical protein [Gemmatimonadales bacterium]
DGRDAVAGVYEVDAFGLPTSGATVAVRVAQSPFRLRGSRGSSEAVAEVANVSGKPVDTEVAMVLAGAERDTNLARHGSDVVRIPFTAPAWARGVAVDLMMDQAQWERFTDFGVSLMDSLGRIVAKEPLNYAVGRLETALPEKHDDMALELRLFPGLADPGTTEAWKTRIAIRLYAAEPVPLRIGGERAESLSFVAGQTKTVRFPLPESPWPLEMGFDPLAVVVAQSGEEVWTRETTLGASGR